jgi:phosphoribosyl-ATP pyrophosphohydrolase/phosphoribosyl-AMP cyclohydrolase
MKINFDKGNGLVPAIVQDRDTMKVLMLGYMNKKAFEKTIKEKKVTFYCRSKKRLWTKGEESGNSLTLEDIKLDCDKDALLVKVKPEGPVCKKGSDTCWGEKNKQKRLLFLQHMSDIIDSRKNDDPKSSYISGLFGRGVKKMAEKVGEEATELVIEAVGKNDEKFIEESADLLTHYMVLLSAKGQNLKKVIRVLEKRHKIR